MQEDFTQNRLHTGISMRFETCEVWVRLFKCVSPMGERSYAVHACCCLCHSEQPAAPCVILSDGEESQRWWGRFFGHCVPSE